MQRLKTYSQFQAVMAGGVGSRTAHFALHRLELTMSPLPLSFQQNASLTGSAVLSHEQRSQALFVVPVHHRPQIWLGPLVPKRWARRSVTRHTIRRQIYAVGAEFLPQLQELPRAAYVVRLRASFDRQHFVSATSEILKQAVRVELQQLFAYAVRRYGLSARAKTVALAASGEGEPGS